MAKNIVLCSDGTGNSGVKGRGTNVFKLFEAIDLNGHRTDPSLPPQLAFYDDGVGTRGNAALRAIGGATGYGLARNVKKLYRELSRVYDEGDRIYLFGFSRGAFTARTLAGMIGTCGVLRGSDGGFTAGALRKAVDHAYQAYRLRYKSVLTKSVRALLGDSGEKVTKRMEDYPRHKDVSISFVGVWDTVDAVGMPFALSEIVNRLVYQFKFPTGTLGPHVKKACQALSIDDQRESFAPVLWSDPDQRIEQVWFSGVHSNVGGGYPKQGMSLVALDWMLAHAKEAELRIQPLDWELFRGHATVDDMLYNSRAGAGVFYRWAPRDVREHCQRSKAEPKIHVSVLERIAHGTDDYAPGNIPPSALVIDTPRHPAGNDARQYSQERAQACEEALHRSLGNTYLLDDVRSEVRMGTASYWFYIVGWLSLVATMILGPWSIWREGLRTWSSVTAGATLALFFAALLLANRVDRRMEERFTAFWQKHQRVLREALKATRERARAQAAQTSRPIGAVAQLPNPTPTGSAPSTS